MTVRPAPLEHLPWIAERANLVPPFQAIEAVDDAGRIHGMVAFSGWTPGAVCVHIALDNPMVLRHLLRPAAGIAFDSPTGSPAGYGKSVAVGTILSTNKRSLRLARRLGFREVWRGRDWWAQGVDMVWLEMRRENCRFIDQDRRAVA